MTESRRSPLLAQIVLLAAFVAIAIVGVLSVLVPELRDDSDAQASSSEAEAASEQ